MAIAITLKEYLDNRGLSYEVIQHPRTDSTLMSSQAAHVPGDRMAKSVLLGDEESYLMAIIPATHHLDIGHLSRLTHRKLELIEEDELVDAFFDCEPGAVPPAGMAYGIHTIADSSLTAQPDIYFESGDHTRLIHITGESFRSLVDETAEEQISHHL